jgi:predicted AAA+ superfamily ATPase
MERGYAVLLARQLQQNRQMVLLSGPRQVGKTTLARQVLEQLGTGLYLNWDDLDDRELILAGSSRLADALRLDEIRAAGSPLLVLDELHKYSRWKSFLKGFFDHYEGRVQVLVTGSARLNIFRKGGDSLMGRYFLHRLHPLGVGELLGNRDSDRVTYAARQLDAGAWENLLRFGGFPEPFLRAEPRFSNRWQRLRLEQLVREDIRDLTRVQELGQLEVLMRLLQIQAGQASRYSSLAKQVRVSVDTVRRWLDILEAFYFCFRIRPWHRNLATALRKEPKTYLWDWSTVTDTGARAENLIACHLLKAVHWWTDLGVGDFELFYLRTKDQKEVDFLVTRDHQPWFMVGVKSAMSQSLNPQLEWFQQRLGVRHAFQVVLDAPYVDADCFAVERPVKVPALGFLSQLP